MEHPDPGIDFEVEALSSQRIATLVADGSALLGEHDVRRVLELALAAGRRATGARYAAIGILDQSRTGLARFETSGIDEATRRDIGDPPQGHGILGLLIREPQPLRLDDIGGHPRSYGFPIGHPPMKVFLGAPIRIRGEVWGNFYLCDRETGEPFGRADEEAIVLLASFVGIAIANAEAREEEAARQAVLQRSVRALEATSAIARAVGDEIELDRVLELVVKRARALVEARATAILLLEGEQLVVAKAAGEFGCDLVGTRIDMLESHCGEVLSTGRSKRFADVGDDPGLGWLTGLRATCLLCTPLFLRGRALGVLAAVDRLDGGPEFCEDDERLLDAFAASGAIAVSIARNVHAEGLRRAIEASERERTRWAREIHDDALQDLAALKLALGRVRRAGDDEAARIEALELADQQVGRAINGLRGIVTDLRPAALDELGIQAAIIALADRAARTSGLTVDVRIDLNFESGRAAERPVPVIEATIYRVVQEALSNVIRHSGARVADVSVAESGGMITVRVRDDGRGMGDGASDSSFGLIGMRERLALVGGVLRVTSVPGGGTLVEGLLPVPGP